MFTTKAHFATATVVDGLLGSLDPTFQIDYRPKSLADTDSRRLVERRSISLNIKQAVGSSYATAQFKIWHPCCDAPRCLQPDTDAVAVGDQYLSFGEIELEQ